MLRIVLVLKGGQYFFPDEWRYQRSLALASEVLEGNLRRVPGDLASYADHAGFVLAGFVPALLHLASLGSLRPSMPAAVTSAWIPALLLSTASVCVVALVYALARRVNASRGEALLAATLAAASNTLFYHSRHLVPYDVALALGLAALLVGLAPDGPWRASLLCGLLSGLSLFCWHGAWPLVGVVIALHASGRGNDALAVSLRRMALAGTTTCLPFFLMHVMSLRLGQEPFLRRMAALSGRVTMGEFAEGWSLPFAYLWHAEHGLAVLWAAGLLGALRTASRRKAGTSAGIWLGAALGIYALLAFSSTGMHRFVVYGRSARLLTPFLCLVTASVLYECLFRHEGRGRRAIGCLGGALLTIQAGGNFRGPLVQRFPLDLEHDVRAFHGEVRRAASLDRPQRTLLERYAPSAVARLRPAPDLVLVNAAYFYPVVASRPLAEGTVLLDARHPLAFLPYQYEGHSPRERELIRKANVRMRLVDGASVLGLQSPSPPYLVRLRDLESSQNSPARK